MSRFYQLNWSEESKLAPGEEINTSISTTASATRDRVILYTAAVSLCRQWTNVQEGNNCNRPIAATLHLALLTYIQTADERKYDQKKKKSVGRVMLRTPATSHKP
jgi:hypothetical protein